MSLTDVEREAMRARLLTLVQKSVTSASDDGRTVADPAEAAEYVVNMLTVHYRKTLRDAAELFGGDYE